MVQPNRMSDAPRRIPILRLGIFHRSTFLPLFTTCVLLGAIGNYYSSSWMPKSDRLLPAGQSSTKQTTITGSSSSSNNNNAVQSIKKKQERDIGFIHVGKTGGATLSRLIRRACFSVEGCQRHAQQLPQPESHISKLVTRYYHMRPAPSPTAQGKQQHTSFLVTARDPLDRAASWYIFRHPANAGRLDVSPTHNSAVLELFACYPNNSFNELVQTGLAPARVAIHRRKQRRCAQLARAIMTGTIQPTRNGDHMAWNYGYYLRDILLNDDNDPAELFVIRTEHLWEDWQNIDVLLGDGNGSAPMDKNYSVSHQRKQSNGDEAPLPVHNKTLSATAMANLCCALRQDLQFYVTALKRAVNLNVSQVQESIDRLELKCGALDMLEKQCRSWDRGGRAGVWDKMLGYVLG